MIKIKQKYKTSLLDILQKKIRKISEVEIPNLYVAAKQYLPIIVQEFANRFGFDKYQGITKIIPNDISKFIARCFFDNSIEFTFMYLLLLTEYDIHCSILHELCHTVHHNHEDVFWKLLEKKLKAAKLIDECCNIGNRGPQKHPLFPRDNFDLIDSFYQTEEKVRCILTKQLKVSPKILHYIDSCYGPDAMIDYIIDIKCMKRGNRINKYNLRKCLMLLRKYESCITFDHMDLSEFINKGIYFEEYIGNEIGNNKWIDASNKLIKAFEHPQIYMIKMAVIVFRAKCEPTLEEISTAIEFISHTIDAEETKIVIIKDSTLNEGAHYIHLLMALSR